MFISTSIEQRLMQVILVILANLLVYNIRIWFVHRLITFHKKKWSIIVGLLFSGIISIAMIRAYHPLLNLLQQPGRGFLENITTGGYISFITYLMLIIAFVYLLTARIRKREYTQAFFFVLTRGIITFLGMTGIIKETALYYMFIAFGEEMSKYAMGNILYQRFSITPRDIIIFTILSALGFAFLENIVYIAYTTTPLSLNQASTLLLKRGILTTSVHAAFTGMIGLGVMFSLLYKHSLPIGGGIMAGVLLHWLFNLSVVLHIMIATPLFMLGSYYMLSYLLFQSDLLYKATPLVENAGS